MKLQGYTFLVFSSILLFTACQSDEPLPNIYQDDLQYLPLEVGKFWEYRLDSITYDNLGALVQDKTGFIRELVVEENINDNDDTIYVVQVSRKKNLADSWVADKLIRIERTDTGFNRVEDNLLFETLKVPAQIGNSWDGNQFIINNIEEIVEGESIKTYINWEYQILERDIEVDVNGELFAEALKVQEADYVNLVDRRFSHATYAKNVGLIHKSRIILHTQCLNNNPPCNESDPWEEKAEKGYFLEQTLINRG